MYLKCNVMLVLDYYVIMILRLILILKLFCYFKIELSISRGF